VLSLELDAWWDDPDYTAAKGSFSSKAAFILGKLMEHDGARFMQVMADLYRDDAPDPAPASTSTGPAEAPTALTLIDLAAVRSGNERRGTNA
jgi:hypothetical protein